MQFIPIVETLPRRRDAEDSAALAVLNASAGTMAAAEYAMVPVGIIPPGTLIFCWIFGCQLFSRKR